MKARSPAIIMRFPKTSTHNINEGAKALTKKIKPPAVAKTPIKNQ